MRFVTAAYGEQYRRMASGLARSFREYVPGHTLMVYGDGQVWGTDVHYLPVSFARTGRLELAIKVGAVAAMSEATDDDVCWIDCDQLVLDDVSAMLKPGKLNVVGYGFDGNRRSIGNGLSVAQENYILSGLFSMPPNVAREYKAQAAGRLLPAEGYDKLIEQELVNRLAFQFADDVHRVDLANPSSVTNFVGGGHPGPKNAEFCSMEVREDRTWWIGARRVATAAFTAECLGQHISCGFESFKHKETRDALLQLYKQGK